MRSVTFQACHPAATQRSAESPPGASDSFASVFRLLFCFFFPDYFKRFVTFYGHLCYFFYTTGFLAKHYFVDKMRNWCIIQCRQISECGLN